MDANFSENTNPDNNTGHRLVKPAQHTRLRHIGHIDEDVVCRVTVQRCAQTLLVKVVTNEADTSSKNEQTVQSSDLDVLVRFFP